MSLVWRCQRVGQALTLLGRISRITVPGGTENASTRMPDCDAAESPCGARRCGRAAASHDARFTRLDPNRAQSRIYSTRIAEVEDPDTLSEHEKPIGRDGGYLWRLYTYWRFLERDGGTYVQCESISLTRGIPSGFGWLVGPFVTSIPRESLAFTLETTRRTLARRAAAKDF